MRVKELSSEYTIKESTIYRWKREFESETGAFKDEATLLLEQENKLLKKQLKEAKMERDILKKAVSIFSISDK